MELIAGRLQNVGATLRSVGLRPEASVRQDPADPIDRFCCHGGEWPRHVFNGARVGHTKNTNKEGCDLVDIPAKANAMKIKTKIQEPWSAITGHRIYFRGHVDEIAPKKLVITEAAPNV